MKKAEIKISIDAYKEIVQILKTHAYTKQEMQEIENDFSLIDDAFAYDHARILRLLGEDLDEDN